MTVAVPAYIGQPGTVVLAGARPPPQSRRAWAAATRKESAMAEYCILTVVKVLLLMVLDVGCDDINGLELDNEWTDQT